MTLLYIDRQFVEALESEEEMRRACDPLARLMFDFSGFCLLIGFDVWAFDKQWAR